MLKLPTYARRLGISPDYALVLFKQGKLPHAAFRISERVVIVDVPEDFGLPNKELKNVVYVRVSTRKQLGSLKNQKARVLEYCALNNIHVDNIVEEVGSGLNDNRPKLSKILGDSTIGTIIVEHSDRLARMNFGLISKCLEARGGGVIVTHADEEIEEDDLVKDITDVLTVLCARYYGKRGATAKAKKLVTQAQEGKTDA